MPAIEETLRTLRDVQGVYGSFVVAGSGALIARDLPVIFDGELLGDVCPRVMRLYETFFSGGEEMEACLLRYADHKLYLRKMTWGLIGIISGVAVNLPALRMVANLVIRRIDPDVTLAAATASALTPRAQDTTLAVRTPAPPPLPPSARRDTQPPAIAQARDSSPPAGDRPVRMYRGRPIVDD